MSNSYRTLIERLRQFADGHYIIQKFYHGQIDAADLDKEPRYPMMHVLPVDIRASEGTLDYALEIRFADIGRDKEIKTDYQKEIISDMSRIALSLISEIENGEVLFGEEAEIVDKQATIIPFIEEFTHVLTGVQLNVTIRLPFNWSACDIPADYSPNITDNPTTGNGILTKIGIYNDGDFVGYTSFVDFSDEFNVSINGNKIEVTLAGGGGGGAVEGVTGNIVDNTDPANPIVTQVQPDWNAVSGVAEILNKPTIPTLTSDLTNDGDDGVNPFITALDLGSYGDMFKSTYDTDNDGIVDKAETVQIIVRNSTGSTLTKGQVVYLSGATGNRPNAVLAQANSEATSSKTIGVVVADIANNSDGNVAVSGTLHDLATNSFTAGDAVWLSATTAGAFTVTPPAEPNHTVFIGYIARAHPTQGRVVIAIQNGYELNELHGVSVPSPSNGQVLAYNSTSGLWENQTITYTEIIRAGASIPASTTRWLVPGLSGFGTSLVVNIAERAIHTTFRIMTGSAQPANGNMTITRQFTTPTGTVLQSDVLTIPAGSAIGVYEFTGSNFDATAIDCNLKFTFVNNGTSSSASVQGLERTFTK